MAAHDLEFVSAQSRELSVASAVYSDLDYAFHLQIEEVLAASAGVEYDAWAARRDSSVDEVVPDDGLLAVRMQSQELERCQQEVVDHGAAEEEVLAVSRQLQQRMHDREFAQSISCVAADEWEEYGDIMERPFSSEGPQAQCDSGYSFSLIIQGEHGSEGHVGLGWILVDPAGKVLWQQSKYLGHGMSRHVAEYTLCWMGSRLLTSLKIKDIEAYGTSLPVCNQINKIWAVQKVNLAELLGQVRECTKKFSSFSFGYLPKATGSLVNGLATHAINNHLAKQLTRSANCTGGDMCTGTSGSKNRSGEGREGTTILERCGICLEDKAPLDMATLKECMHKFCVACMKLHAEVQVQARQVRIRCPQDKCPKMVAVDECRNFLSSEVFNSFTKRLAEDSIPERDRVYCPFRNCSALMDKSGFVSQMASSSAHRLTTISRTKCVVCERNFCVECRVAWHQNLSCQDFQSIPPHLRDGEDSNLYKLAANQHWQRCCKCGCMIELAEGCYHMTCRCGYEFCYKCGAEWKEKKQTCSCKLWDERNIVRSPINSDTESDDDVQEPNNFYGPNEDMNAGDELMDYLHYDHTEPSYRFYKTKLCKFYERGYCTAGQHCNFAHGEEELR